MRLPLLTCFGVPLTTSTRFSELPSLPILGRDSEAYAAIQPRRSGGLCAFGYPGPQRVDSEFRVPRQPLVAPEPACAPLCGAAISWRAW
jgi:hypothetical protein